MRLRLTMWLIGIVLSLGFYSSLQVLLLLLVLFSVLLPALPYLLTPALTYVSYSRTPVPDRITDLLILLSLPQYLTAFIGVNSMLISVLLPVLFYYVIHRETLAGSERVWCDSLLLLCRPFD